MSGLRGAGAPAADDAGCLGEDLLMPLLTGALTGDQWPGVDAHLDRCERCRLLVAAAAADDAAADGDDAPAADPPLLPSGATLSRYVILRVVGSGGMGVVYAAYDPELDRQVAVKVLRPGVQRAGGARQLRVFREAQAMARLTHPNVVAVHDVGMLGERLFVVMEFVRGSTLRGWLAAGPRPWKEVVSVFRRAGAGLAAAHAAGLVHRDFKPDNVLVDLPDRVLVTDFGLASAADWDPAAPGAADGLAVDRPSRAGGIVGTPAYMSPEQLDGEAVDLRADVFGFCVALYEALYGERPFAGDTIWEIRKAILRGRVREPPKGASVPSWVRQIVLRGLAADPSRRPASIDEITAALDRDPAAKRRRALVAGGAVLAAAAVVLAVALPLRAQQLACRGAERKLQGVWDAERRQSISRALVSSGKPGAEATAHIVEGALDRYTRDWAAMRAEACEATHVTHEQSEALLDLRMRCLDERLAEVRGLTDLLSERGGELAGSAAKAAYALSSLRPCADAKALLAPVPLPADPAVRAEVEGLRLALAQVRVMRDLGRYREGEALAAGLRERARPLSFAPLDADVLEVWGEFQRLVADYPRAAGTLQEALRAAERGRDRRLAAMALIQLGWVVGNEQGQSARGHEYGSHAAALLEGLGGDAELEALLARNEGAIFYNEGRIEEASAAFRRALDKQRVASGPVHPLTATALLNVGILLGQEERHAEALEMEERALAVFAETAGDHHPAYGAALSDAADELCHLGRLDEARAHAERALAIVEGALGPDHAYAAWVEQTLGLVATEQRRHAEAERHLRRALALTERLRGADHPHVAYAASDLARALALQGRSQEAVALSRRALAIYAQHGGDARRSARASAGMGTALLAMKQPAEALAAFEAALAWQEAHEKSPRELGRTRFGAAQALWETGGDRERARRLAAQAVQSYAEAGPLAGGERAAAEAWLEGVRPGR